MFHKYSLSHHIVNNVNLTVKNVNVVIKVTLLN